MDLKISKKPKLPITPILLSLSIVTAVLLIYLKVNEQKAYKKIAVQHGPLYDAIITTGTVEAINRRSVSAITKGQVIEINVTAGETVNVNTVLAKLSDPELQHQVNNQKITYSVALSEYTARELELAERKMDLVLTIANINDDVKLKKLELAAKEKLAQQGILPDIELLKAQTSYEQLKRKSANESQRLSAFERNMQAQLNAQKAKVEQQKALYEQLLSQFSGLTIKAGMSGILQNFSLSLGQTINSGEEIAKIANLSHLILRIKIPEAAMQNISVNDSVKIYHGDSVFSSELNAILPNAKEGFVEAIANLPHNDKSPFRIDANLRVEIAKQQQHTSWLPETSFLSTGKNQVYIVDGEMAILSEVTLSDKVNNKYTIVNGLNKDQTILAISPEDTRYKKILEL